MESAESVTFNASSAFPLASLTKVVSAIGILRQVDDASLHLGQLVAVEPRHVCPGGGIEARFRVPGVALSVDNLLRSALVESDNTAADVLLDAAGGPSALQTLVERHAPGIRVDRSLRDILQDVCGAAVPEGAPFDSTLWNTSLRKPYSPELQARLRAFVTDPRDTATPLALVQLLARLYRREIRVIARPAGFST